MIIQNNMAVICRTEEERDIYIEIATKEGWRNLNGRAISKAYALPMNYATGYVESHTYPNGVSQGVASKLFPSHLTVVEASQLFKNQLIARRLKHETRS